MPERPTFTEHVASLIHARCVSCHRPGQVGPFALISEAEIRDHAEQIVAVTKSRFMPPWKPVRGHGEFVGDRSLTPAQIDLLARWVEQGAPTGPEHARPAPPQFPEGWLGGRPDLIIELPEAYELGPEGLDRYRNFVLSSPVSRRVWVRGWELDPGDPQVVHHAILNVDRGGWALAEDARDPGPGFEAMDVAGGQSPGGFYLVWAPGTVPTEASHGAAWALDPGMHLILQLHLQPSGKPERVAPRVGLYLSDEMGNVTFEVVAGDKPGHLTLRESKYRRALRFDGSATAHYNLANVLRARGDLAGAEAEYRAALDQDPNHLWSLHNLSMLLPGDRRFAEAIELGAREVALTPNAAAAHNNLGNALRGAERRDEAIAAFRRALELEPGYALALNNLRALGVQ